MFENVYINVEKNVFSKCSTFIKVMLLSYNNILVFFFIKLSLVSFRKLTINLNKVAIAKLL